MKNYSKRSSVYIVDYYVIKIKDNETHLNNFTAKTTFHSTLNINNNIISQFVIYFQVFTLHDKNVTFDLKTDTDNSKFHQS